jgi:hypothetical protein
MKENNLENLFAAARSAPIDDSVRIPDSFVDKILRIHQRQFRERQTFRRTSIASICTAIIVLCAALGYNFDAPPGSSGSDDQDSMVDLPPSLWDPAGN